MSAAETIYRSCAGCGVTFGQPNDPGRKRDYHDAACKQRAYRARAGKTGHESRTRARQERARQQFTAEEEAWAQEQARREAERERSERRREERRRQQEQDEYARRSREAGDRARRERDRQRQDSTAGRTRGEQTETPAWTRPRAGDSRDVAKRRRTAHLLYVRANHGGTTAHEARECRKKAETLRVIYGL